MIDLLLFSHSVVSDSFATPMDYRRHQGPLSMIRILEWVAISSSKEAS